jgi:hypothetical protein
MDKLWEALSWSGPIGVGFGLAGLGVFFWLGAKALFILTHL